MAQYKNGKIYILRTQHTDKCYIGSTYRELNERLAIHKCNFNTNKIYYSAFELFKLGIDDVKIELIENYPCDNKTQLCKREGE